MTSNNNSHGERMPLASRAIFTLVALIQSGGAHAADFFTNTHIFNSHWPPHAKFHTGHTLSLSIFLGLASLYFAFRRTRDRLQTIIAAALFASAYWVTQATASLYPGTAFWDPEFESPDLYWFGIPAQAVLDPLLLFLIGIAVFFAIRRNSKWT